MMVPLAGGSTDHGQAGHSRARVGGGPGTASMDAARSAASPLVLSIYPDTTPVPIPSRRWQRLLPLLGLAVLALACWALWRELEGFQWSDLTDYWRKLSWGKVALACLAIATSFLLLTGHDWLALRVLGLDQRLRMRLIGLISFSSYVVSMNAGGTFVTGGAVRLRSYTALGLTPGDVGRVVFLCMFFGACGQMFYAGVLFAAWSMPWPEELADDLPLALGTTRPLGLLLLLLATVISLGAILRRRPLRWGKINVVTPQAPHALLGISFAAAEWLLACVALALLLPTVPELAIGQVLTIVLLAKMAALISHVPGGLGVFEVVVLTMMPEGVSNAEILGALLIFRLIYYVIPLALAATLLLGKEYWLLKVKRRNGGR